MHKTIYVRHAQANFPEKGMLDIHRDITRDGAHAAYELRSKLKALGVGLVLTSPAVRARRSAEIATSYGQVKMIVIPELYPDPNDEGVGRELNALSNRPGLGDAPVSMYLQVEDGKTLLTWALDAKHKCVSATQAGRLPEAFAIFGHAPGLCAIAMHECEEGPNSVYLIGKLAGIRLMPCQGFAVVYDHGWPQEIEML